MASSIENLQGMIIQPLGKGGDSQWGPLGKGGFPKDLLGMARTSASACALIKGVSIRGQLQSAGYLIGSCMRIRRLKVLLYTYPSADTSCIHVALGRALQGAGGELAKEDSIGTRQRRVDGP